MTWCQCYIGLGSNLGDSEATLSAAVNALTTRSDVRRLILSSLYQSKPHGPQDQPDYINAVAGFETQLSPIALLDVLQSIETQFGRLRSGERWTARTLDLDILLFDNQHIDTGRLKVPHPWMTQREFVLYPLFEIAPTLQLPDGSSLKTHLSNVPENGLIRRTVPHSILSRGSLDMQIVHSIAQLRAILQNYRLAGESVGLVPTMGNLHAGHLDLVRIAGDHAVRKVVSIFVNPTQFDKKDDLDKYPRTLKEDLAKLDSMGVDLVFAPEPAEMYPHGDLVTLVDVPGIGSLLEGSSRPGHFRGVATVVTKLFNIVSPDVAVFGQKDFQQLMLIRQMVSDLDMPIEIVEAPTMREPDGLAMSSRNNRLSEAQRALAPNLQRVLKQIEIQLSEGVKTFGALQEAAMAELDALGFRSDYVRICQAQTLQPAQPEDKSLVILAAAYVGEVRLIDNIPVQLT